MSHKHLNRCYHVCNTGQKKCEKVQKTGLEKCDFVQKMRRRNSGFAQKTELCSQCLTCFFYNTCDDKELFIGCCEYYLPLSEETEDLIDIMRTERDRTEYREQWFDYIREFE